VATLVAYGINRVYDSESLSLWTRWGCSLGAAFLVRMASADGERVASYLPQLLTLAYHTGRRISAVLALLFPTATDPRQPVHHHLAAAWLRQTEKLAGLEPLQGGAWHPFRRAWATAVEREVGPLESSW